MYQSAKTANGGQNEEIEAKEGQKSETLPNVAPCATLQNEVIDQSNINIPNNDMYADTGKPPPRPPMEDPDNETVEDKREPTE